MNDTRKQIIIKEIEYWKQNRLLPEQYCNYLLTLYSEGEHETSESHIRGKTNTAFSFIQIVILFLLPALFLVTYFNEMSFGLQMALQIILVLTSLTFSVMYRKKNPLYHTFYTSFTFLLFFLLTIESVEYFFSQITYIIELTVLLHCSLWYVVGKKLQLRFLTVSGLVVILLLLILIVYKLFNL